MSEQQLRPVREGELESLRATLVPHLPHSSMVMGAVENALHYNDNAAYHHPFTILVPEPSSGSSLVVVISANFKAIQEVSVFWSVDKDPNESITRLLASSTHIDWTRPILLNRCPPNILQRIEVMNLGGVSLVDYRLFGTVHRYTLDADHLSSYKLSEGYYLSSLRPHDTDVVLAFYKFRSVVTRESIWQRIVCFPSVAIRMRISTQGKRRERDAQRIEADRETKIQKEDTEVTNGNAEYNERRDKPKHVNEILTDVNDEKLAGEGQERELNGEGQERALDGGVKERDRLAGEDQDRAPGGSEEEGELVSWILLGCYGDMANTYTLPSHRRQGLARAATLAMARRLIQEGRGEAQVTIGEGNMPSITFHESIGFRKSCSLNNVCRIPVGTDPPLLKLPEGNN